MYDGILGLTPVIEFNVQSIAARYGVLLEDLGIALRGLFIINPQGVIEQITINSLPIGRNVDEALRLVPYPTLPCPLNTVTSVCPHILHTIHLLHFKLT